jgi:hypothetical protein
LGVDGPSSSLLSCASLLLLLSESENAPFAVAFFEAFLLDFFLDDFFFFRGLGATAGGAGSNGCGDGSTLRGTTGVRPATLLSSLSLGAAESAAPLLARIGGRGAATAVNTVRGDAAATPVGVPRNERARSAVVDDFGVGALSGFSLFFLDAFFFAAPEASAASLYTRSW